MLLYSSYLLHRYSVIIINIGELERIFIGG